MTSFKTQISPDNTHSILINKLILVGHRKNYVIPFYPGVNIIYGDSATGKSSILQLISYLLGGSSFLYEEEIESSVVYAALEVNLGPTLYTIKRDIYDNSRPIEVYKSDFDNIDKFFPKKFSPKYTITTPDGFYLDFLMQELNLPSIRLRQAPTQSDSTMVRLSFRDIFKFCHLDQEDIGSKHILDAANPVVAIKNKETFKYFFNLLDTNISDLAQEISEKTTFRNRLSEKYTLVSEFLRETEFESSFSISDSTEELDSQATALTEELEDIKKRIYADSENYRNLKDILSEITLQLNNSQHLKLSAELAIDRYSRLKNDYLNDIEKLKAIRVAKSIIGVSEHQEGPCPICDNLIELNTLREHFNISDQDKVNHELLVLNRRIKDLSEMIESEKNTIIKSQLDIKAFEIEQNRARRMLDESSNSVISPYISQRDGILIELTSINEKKHQLEKSLKIRNQQKAIFEEMEKSNTDISLLNEKLNKLRELAPSLDEILDGLSDFMIQYLKKIGIKNQHNISISKKNFLPDLRDRDYVKITSGGLRTILSIGHYANLHKTSLFLDMNFPRLLMIDTVGKYLGKTKDRFTETDVNEDKLENVADPEKYRNIYEYLCDIAESAEQRNLISQIILVDNDVPEYIKQKYSGFIVAHYSSDPDSGLQPGLIDDFQKYPE